MLLRGERPWTLTELQAIEALKRLGWTPRDMAACCRQSEHPRTAGGFDRALDALFDRTPEEALRFANQLAGETERRSAPEIIRSPVSSVFKGFLLEMGLGAGRARA